jgi:hypothetical protein
MQMRSTPDLSFNRVVIVSVCEKPQLVMAKAPGKLAGMDTTLKSKGSGWSEDLWFRNRLSALTVDGLLPSVVPSGSQGSLTERRGRVVLTDDAIDQMDERTWAQRLRSWTRRRPLSMASSAT